jgi:hypothetical protein
MPGQGCSPSSFLRDQTDAGQCVARPDLSRGIHRRFHIQSNVGWLSTAGC